MKFRGCLDLHEDDKILVMARLRHSPLNGCPSNKIFLPPS